MLMDDAIDRMRAALNAATQEKWDFDSGDPCILNMSSAEDDERAAEPVEYAVIHGKNAEANGELIEMMQNNFAALLDCATALQAYAAFAAQRRDELGSLSDEMEQVDVLARAALAKLAQPTTEASGTRPVSCGM